MNLSIKEFNKIPVQQRNGIFYLNELEGTFYYVNGNIHREDGPAIEYINGTKVWRINNKLHRLDGPAIEWHTGDKSYYIEDKSYTKEEFDKVAYFIKNGLQNYL